MTIAERIQAYLLTRWPRHEQVRVASFTAFWHPESDDPDVNFVLPHEPIHGDIGTALDKLRELSRERQRPLQIQYLDTYSPTLTRILTDKGFTPVGELKVMVCTPETYRPAPTMPGLSTLILSENSSVEDVRQGLHTHELGFDPTARQLHSTDAEMFRRTLITSRAFILRYNHEPVTTGMFTEVHDGVTELTAISTVPSYRQRGFGAYLTGYMAQVAFARQVDLIFLVVQGNESETIYQRVGFQPQAMLLTYRDEL